jgi:hypothetical protein
LSHPTMLKSRLVKSAVWKGEHLQERAHLSV